MASFSSESRLQEVNEEAVIRAVVQKYFDGIMHYDLAILREAFYPDAQVMSFLSPQSIIRDLVAIY